MFVKVAVIYNKKSSGFVSAIQRAKEYLYAQGFDLSFHMSPHHKKLPDCDIAMIDGYSATEYVLNHYRMKQICILEKADSASVFFRDLLKDERVDALLKGSKLHPENENYKNYRFAEYLCGGVDDPPHKINVLSFSDLKKISFGPSFFSYNCLEDWQNINDPLEKHRNIDVHCVVSTEKYPKNIKAMRKKAVNIIAGMDELRTITGEGRPYPVKVYREQLIDTKIVVAPFGNGYSSYRMAEAMLAGCVLIVPECEFAQMAGNPLRENVTYVACRHDYKDLDDKIQYVLANWDSFFTLRKFSQELAREIWSPDFIGQTIAEQLTNLYIKHPFID